MAINGHFVKKMCGIFIGLVASFGDTSLPFLVPQLIYLLNNPPLIDDFFPFKPPFITHFTSTTSISSKFSYEKPPFRRDHGRFFLCPPPSSPLARCAPRAPCGPRGGCSPGRPMLQGLTIGVGFYVPKKIPSPDQMVRFMWKFPTKPWFRLGGWLVLGGWD